MGKARLVIDPHQRYSAESTALVVRMPSDYVVARRRLYTCIEDRGNEEDSDVVIVVRHDALRQWFSDLSASPCVEYTVYSPLADFARTFNLQMPTGLVDADVVELDLEVLAQRCPPTTNDAYSWIVSNRLGAVWLEQGPPAELLAEVLRTALGAPLHNVWLLQQAQAQLGLWRQRDTSATNEIWTFLCSDALQLRARALVAYAAVAKYPKPYRKEWLGELWNGLDALETLDSVAEALRDVPLPEAVRARLEEHVRTFLIDKADTADLDQLLSYTTGTLANEARVIARALLKRPRDLTRAIFDKLAAITWLEDGAFLDRLRRLLPVPAPVPIAEQWNSAQINDVGMWVQKQYLPWYQAVRNRDEEVDSDPINSSFAGWLGRAYPDLMARLPMMVMGARDRIDAITTTGRSVIWIVVDALGIEWADTLVDACSARGMTVTDRAVQLTLLPTITNVAKPALLSGRPPILDSAVRPAHSLPEYRRMVDDGRWGDRGALMAAEWERCRLVDFVSSQEASVWIYLVNQLDKDIVHERMSFEERARRVGRLCSDLAEAAHEAQEAAVDHYGRRPAVVFSADHGFTTPARGAREVDSDGRTVEGRCVQLDEGDVPLDDGWLTLDPPNQFGLTKRYALLYGNRFLGETSPLIATHGGANPEEVFVPYIECDGVPLPTRAPRIRIASVIKPDVERQDIDVVIANDNAATITAIAIDADTFDEPVLVGEVRGKDEVVARCTLIGGPYAPGLHHIMGTTQYHLGPAEKQAETMSLTLEVSRPLQATTGGQQDFEDMFDE